MIEGLFLITLTALFWCGNGIIFSYAARKSLNFVAIMVVATFLGTILSLVIFSKPAMLLNGISSRVTELAIIMLTSGIIGTVGIIIMQKSMRWGHHGIIWTISQSAMIIPFFFGIFIFKEPVTWRQYTGIFLVILSFLAFGAGQTRLNSQTTKSFILWFPLALLAFAILGIHQSLSTIPSYWQNWQDSANLRAPLINAGFFLAYLAPMIFYRQMPNRATIKLSILSAVFVFASPITLFRSMDFFSKINLVSLVYPLTVGICIIVFFIYSCLFLKEKLSPSIIFGMITGITGLMLISI